MLSIDRLIHIMIRDFVCRTEYFLDSEIVQIPQFTLLNKIWAFSSKIFFHGKILDTFLS